MPLVTADGIREDPLAHCVLKALVLGLLPRLDMGVPRHSLLEACQASRHDMHFGAVNEVLKQTRVPWRLSRVGDPGEYYTAAELRTRFGSGLVFTIALILTLILTPALTLIVAPTLALALWH